jgi:Protein of unknown function (DUF4238)
MGQHTVPQRYLRSFEDSDHPGFIWLHDKRGELPSRQVAIDKILQQRQFYPDDMERHLAKVVELPANRVIDGVRQSLEQKVGLSRVRPSLATRVLRVVQRPQLAAGNGLRQRE